MKRFILLLFMTPLILTAQTSVYHPFPYSNAIWTFQNSDVASNDSGSCTGINICYIDYQYRLLGDTIVSGKKYANIYCDVSFANCSCGPNSSQSVYAGYAGAIRNDTLNKRVYSANFTGTEQLLYDFNWVVGDTFTTCNNIIAVVDSVMIGSNYRKRFITSDSVHFIEGIGYVGMVGGNGSDLFWSQCSLSMSPYYTFICYTDSTESYVLHPEYCNPITIGIPNEPYQETTLNIYPNPSINRITIKFNKAQYRTNVKIISVLGEEIRNMNFTGEELIIEKNEIKNGIYFIQTLDERNIVTNRKVIIE
ncbi:MAG: T9SS type A sorting domain-containing protein [Bacteroidia bacterium]|nr:T9SS type A sorting domain-containing protein [Bacteroidia bacterium]